MTSGMTSRADGPVGPARLLLIECPELDAPVEDDGGRLLRRFAPVVESLVSVCPWIDVVRPGVCALPLRGPVRYFGTEQAVVELVRETVAGALAQGEKGPAAEAIRLGIAEGLFAAALAAAEGVAVPAGETADFLSSWPVDVLGDRELADVLVRLGLTTLGKFAQVPVADVLARFGVSGVRRHRIARGLDGELPGYRVPGLDRRLVALLGRELALIDHQPGFWGGTSAADERAAEALSALQRRLGPEAVMVPVVSGGRGPSDRCRLVPWRPHSAVSEGGAGRSVTEVGVNNEKKNGERRGSPPWPGRLPPPAPARVLAGECPADLHDEDGAHVGVTSRGLLTARPVRLSLAGGPWRPVTAWSAPWPVEERWWSRGRHRAARLQVLAGHRPNPGAGGTSSGTPDETGDATGFLLVVERGRWRVEAVYD